MMSDPVDSDAAIELVGVTKRFKLYHDPIAGPLKEALLFWRKRHQHYAEKLAVEDVSATIRRGEVVGIIGANGAGKTTLLRMIAGLLLPDEGKVVTRGKISAILAMGIGINNDATGRENIRIAGLLLGMTGEEIAAKTERIIDFAEIGAYIDQPFRTYSSGMQSRLLFAISTSVDPEIFIVDEALAAGDVRFVRKCSRRIRDIASSGATVLFVSHSISVIQNLCQRILVMKDGRIVGDGPPDTMVQLYYDLIFADEATQAEARLERPVGMISGTGEVKIGNVRTTDTAGTPCSAFYSGDTLVLDFEFTTTLPLGTPARLFVGIDRADAGEFVGEIHTAYHIDADTWEETRTDLRLPTCGRLRVRLAPLLLLNDHYSFWIIFANEAKSHYFCEYRFVGHFFVSRREYSLFKGEGIFWHPVKIDIESVEAEPLDSAAQ